jgi:hypothetical protein
MTTVGKRLRAPEPTHHDGLGDDAVPVTIAGARHRAAR